MVNGESPKLWGSMVNGLSPKLWGSMVDGELGLPGECSVYIALGHNG